MIEPIDLGVCRGYEYQGDPARTAIAMPGAMLGGMPAVWWAMAPAFADGWRIVYVWDEFLDRSQDATRWVESRAEAAAAYAGTVRLLIAKSLTTRAAGLAADRGWPAVWLTPLLVDDEVVAGLQRRTAPALLVGGTEDPAWDGAIARELSDDVLELDGADHGLARVDQAQEIADRVRAFLSGRLRA